MLARLVGLWFPVVRSDFRRRDGSVVCVTRSQKGERVLVTASDLVMPCVPQHIPVEGIWRVSGVARFLFAYVAVVWSILACCTRADNLASVTTPPTLATGRETRSLSVCRSVYLGVPGSVGLGKEHRPSLQPTSPCVGCTGLGWAWQYTRLSLRM